ncbi:MAG: bifunctional phosphoribosylaminoimidazolecarboxamide formyltransferase/IMP cyclohydrolase [Planctomycetota bacterium]
MKKIENALVSVSDKTGLPEFVRRLVDLGVDIIATGGTAKLLREHDIEVRDVSDYTGFPEILDGRVKTLHPGIHAGLLADRDNAEHQEQIRTMDIDPLDMVVVNLLPAESAMRSSEADVGDAVKNIDIGGATLIRSAAKNYPHVAVVTDPSRYDEVAEEMERRGGCLHENTRYDLALKGFQHTAHYDAAIARQLGQSRQDPGTHQDLLILELDKHQELRYGENPHQTAAFYVERERSEPSVSTANQVAGPELSFNNIVDIDVGLELIKEFDLPAAACVKHANPTGAAKAESVHEAYRSAYLGDPQSAPGSAIILNRTFDVPTASLISEFSAGDEGEPLPNFVEAIAAPSIDSEALKYLYRNLHRGSSVRLLETGPLSAICLDQSQKDMHRVVGGMLVQDRDLLGFDQSDLEVVSDRAPTEEQMRDLGFAWVCCKHLKSNAVVLATECSLVGAGAGHMNRLEAARTAIRKAGEQSQGAVMASDGFLPSEASLRYAAEAGVKAIIQPGGAGRDEEIIHMADELQIPMVLGGARHFCH